MARITVKHPNLFLVKHLGTLQYLKQATGERIHTIFGPLACAWLSVYLQPRGPALRKAHRPTTSPLWLVEDLLLCG